MINALKKQVSPPTNPPPPAAVDLFEIYENPDPIKSTLWRVFTASFSGTGGSELTPPDSENAMVLLKHLLSLTDQLHEQITEYSLQKSKK